MRVVRHDDARAFQETCGELLGKQAIECQVKLRTTSRLAMQRDLAPDAWFASVESNGSPVGACLQTPPRHLLISNMAQDACEVLGHWLLGSGMQIPGVNGPARSAEAVARVWQDAGVETALLARMRAYRLDDVKPVLRPGGAPRRAAGDDLPCVRVWYEAFRDEAVPHDDFDPAQAAQQALDEGRLWLWDDAGEVCAMAGFSFGIQDGAGVAPVYTPQARRGRGYASALVAHMSQWLLDQGAAYCCLYADSSNLTAQRIYARMGYRSQGEICNIAFR